MRCPHCSAPLMVGTPACRCGFSAEAMRRYLGTEWVRLERITDQSHRLGRADQRRIEDTLDAFERQFPQVFLALYLGPLPVEITVGDFGFWLVNHGAFHTHLGSKRNDFGMVLVVDPLRQAAALTIGYALEAVLDEADLNKALLKGRHALGRQDIARAVEKITAALAQNLRRQGARQPHDLPLPPPVGDPSLLGLEPLRRRHTPANPLHGHIHG